MAVTSEMLYEAAIEILATTIRIDRKLADMLMELRSLRLDAEHLAQEVREAVRSLVRHPEVRA